MSKHIVKGSIVKYNDGWYRVTSLRGSKVNLGAVFGGPIYHKGLDVGCVVEDEAAWYARWQQSETYQSM